MSRIGKRPISIPNKVTITLDGQKVAVKGPKGELSELSQPKSSWELKARLYSLPAETNLASPDNCTACAAP